MTDEQFARRGGDATFDSNDSRGIVYTVEVHWGGGRLRVGKVTRLYLLSPNPFGTRCEHD